MATAIEEKIKRLEEKLKQAKTLKREKDIAQRMAENKAKRAAETRKKILLGAVLLERFESDQQLKDHCFHLLERTLIRTDDRALFGLPPLPNQKEAS